MNRLKTFRPVRVSISGGKRVREEGPVDLRFYDAEELREVIGSRMGRVFAMV
jgi:hypothetical protein